MEAVDGGDIGASPVAPRDRSAMLLDMLLLTDEPVCPALDGSCNAVGDVSGRRRSTVNTRTCEQSMAVITMILQGKRKGISSKVQAHFKLHAPIAQLSLRNVISP